MKMIFDGFRITCVLLAVSLWAFPAHAQPLTTAADDSRLWILMPETDRPEVFSVYHHAFADPPSLITKVQTLRGEVLPHSVAARDDSLWIIYPDGAFQAIRAEPSLLKDGWGYRARVEPTLPSGASVRAMVITQSGPWVLVRVEDHESLLAIDAMSQPAESQKETTTARRRRNLAIGLPPQYGLSDQDDAETQATHSTTTDNAKPVDAQPQDAPPVALSLPVDRMLYLEHGSWRTYPLPQDWPHGAEAWLVAERDRSERPTLIARSSHSETQRPDTIEVFREAAHTPHDWSVQTYSANNTDGDGIVLMGVESQLVLAQHFYDQGQLTATLSVLRDGKAFRVGTMSLEDVSPKSWSVLGTGDTAILIAHRPTPDLAAPDSEGLVPLIWAQIDVRGHSVLEPTELMLKTRSPMDDLAQYVMLGLVMVLITVLMLAFWRRDAEWNKLDLPPDVVIADLGRRAIAAAVDMAPGLLGAMSYFDLSFEDLLLRWPGNGIANAAQQMLPGAAVIAVFVIHTTLTEMVFARTLGKSLVGLRTVTLTGSRPRPWQLLVRGLLKTLDLIPWAWLLLMLPVIAPHRQRLGDLVGRTVVVCDVPPITSDQDSGDSNDDPTQ